VSTRNRAKLEALIFEDERRPSMRKFQFIDVPSILLMAIAAGIPLAMVLL
jgi:hypothetical protein